MKTSSQVLDIKFLNLFFFQQRLCFLQQTQFCYPRSGNPWEPGEANLYKDSPWRRMAFQGRRGRHGENTFVSNLGLNILIISKLGGLDLSRRGLDRDSRSRHRKKVSLDSRENLDSFKKLVSTIEMSLAKTVLFGRDRDFSRPVETFVIFLDFSIFFSISIEK